VFGNRTLKEINRELRETRAEMRAKGIRRTSCFNGGLSGEAYSLNARMFRLETERQDAIKKGDR
jgi:hypothetical protein